MNADQVHLAGGADSMVRNSDLERSAFEAWAKRLLMTTSRQHDDAYCHIVTEGAWLAWQESAERAARDSVEALKEADWYIGQLEALVYSSDDTAVHESRAKVQAAISRATQPTKGAG